MKIALAVSLIANIVLAILLATRGIRECPLAPAAPPIAYCDSLKKDLDFFIEGLTKGNDPFYTPLAVQTLGTVMPPCFPGQSDKIKESLSELRHHLLFLVAANTSQEQKRQAHEAALRIFRQLRELYGAST